MRSSNSRRSLLARSALSLRPGSSPALRQMPPLTGSPKSTCPARTRIRPPTASTMPGRSSGCLPTSSGIHGFLDTGGKFTQIDVPEGCSTEAHGINDAGQIVGVLLARRTTASCTAAAGSPNSTSPAQFGRCREESMTADRSWAVYRSASATLTASFTPAATFTQIDVPGADCYAGSRASTTPGRSSGIIEVSAHGFATDHGFLDSGGSFTQIDVPGAIDTVPLGINDVGQIVGSCQRRQTRLCRHRAAASPKSTCPAHILRRPMASTTAGQIVGIFGARDGISRFPGDAGWVGRRRSVVYDLRRAQVRVSGAGRIRAGALDPSTAIRSRSRSATGPGARARLAASSRPSPPSCAATAPAFDVDRAGAGDGLVWSTASRHR